MNEAIEQTTTANVPSDLGAPWRAHVAEFEAAHMRDLVTLGRLFFAAVNMRAREWSDDEMATLARFDDVLSELIVRRRPTSAEEFAEKTRYLLGRIEAEDMADAVEQQAWHVLRREAAAFCAVPDAREASA
ncbi:hypothetical protein [Neoroseomonas oryzicola]|uniref:Uncharacterized protein n=1 Tax=Neoroseomonas oryzicola TaxID=535904 RepID=A0A9X9WLW9_9PROT|nr:hypothetical protein [Neoroseomonas oryzicola]MBR0661329.1 hypothetical protein [Neoroseomonas oryzicola]NKE18819.1 hypothetical protein [Neoroseomonas oryzicola]